MKLLMIYMERFTYKTTIKTLDMAKERDEERQIKDALVGFIHVEKEDE